MLREKHVNEKITGLGLFAIFIVCTFIGVAFVHLLRFFGINAVGILSNSMNLMQDTSLIVICTLISKKYGLETNIFSFHFVKIKWLVNAIILSIIIIFFAYGTQSVITLIVANVDKIFAYSFFGYHEYGYKLIVGLFGYVLIIISQFIIGPIAEELFFRVLLLRVWAKKYGTSAGILLSSIAFTALHFERHFFINIFVFSIIASLIYIKYKSIWVSALFHASNNAIAFYLEYIINFHTIKLRSNFMEIHTWVPEIVMLVISFPMVFILTLKFWPKIGSDERWIQQ